MGTSPFDEPSPKLQRRPARVLIVEDDVDLRWSLVDQVESVGIAAEAAADGLEALSKMERGFAPDAILLDLAMPVMSGLEFLRHREAEPRLAAVPTIVLTASAALASQVTGVREVLRKPLDVARLRALVTEAVERRPRQP